MGVLNVAPPRVNTSNPGKRAEFERFFGAHGIRVEFTAEDLHEIDADPLTVVAHKASRFGATDRVIVEDTVLAVDGVDVGINVRWMLGELPRFVGRAAVWTAHLAYRDADEVLIFTGEISGTIVAPRGTGFGFDPIFQPEGTHLTFAEDNPPERNARWRAVEKLISGRVSERRPVLSTWDGPWQP